VCPRYSPERRIEPVAQKVTYQIDGNDQYDQGKAREQNNPPFTGEQVVGSDVDQGAQGRLIRRHPTGTDQ